MFKNREGEKVPQVTFRTRQGDQWVEVTTDDLFAGKTVACFALPGAFTPTCSSTHLPRYNELAAELQDAGVDRVVCVSVNDAFVMNAWKETQEADHVTVVPDGNGEFTEAMGMLVDKSNLGFGKRSWRYSMLVRDGVIEKMFIEPEKPGDPFEVSDADTMLRYLRPDAPLHQDVTVFTKAGCPHCARAKALLQEKGRRYEEIQLGAGVTTATLRAVAGATTVPQVFIDGEHVGGADELERYFAKLDAAAA